MTNLDRYDSVHPLTEEETPKMAVYYVVCEPPSFENISSPENYEWGEVFRAPTSQTWRFIKMMPESEGPGFFDVTIHGMGLN